MSIDFCDVQMIGSRRKFDELIRRARGGCNESLGSLIEACRRYLLAVANREMSPKLRAKVSPQDLVQDTALAAQQCFCQFNGGQPSAGWGIGVEEWAERVGQGDASMEFLAWLRGILIHNLSNTRRHFQKTAKRQISRELPLDDADEVVKDRLIAQDIQPADAAIAKESARIVREAIGHLPEQFREVVLLRHYDDRSFTEIAEQMGRSTEAVRKVLQRAVARLAQGLSLADDD